MKVKVSRKLDNLESLVQELKKSSDEIGAIAIFIGNVRGKREDEKVVRLDYETHRALASRTIRKIVEDLKSKYGIVDATVEHRIGTVRVGEAAIYALIASSHREEGFKALTELVDRIKHEVPIWKKEITEKGAHWVENPRPF